MDEMEEKLGSILGNPDMMQQIMAMAQSLGAGQSQPSSPDPSQEDPPGPDLGGLDIGMIQKIAGFAQKSNIDSDQRNLLKALGPYLAQERIHKLEKAMRAAKLARLASGFLGELNLSGR